MRKESGAVPAEKRWLQVGATVLLAVGLQVAGLFAVEIVEKGLWAILTLPLAVLGQVVGLAGLLRVLGGAHGAVSLVAARAVAGFSLLGALAMVVVGLGLEGKNELVLAGGPLVFLMMAYGWGVGSLVHHWTSRTSLKPGPSIAAAVVGSMVILAGVYLVWTQLCADDLSLNLLWVDL